MHNIMNLSEFVWIYSMFTLITIEMCSSELPAMRGDYITFYTVIVIKSSVNNWYYIGYTYPLLLPTCEIMWWTTESSSAHESHTAGKHHIEVLSEFVLFAFGCYRRIRNQNRIKKISNDTKYMPWMNGPLSSMLNTLVGSFLVFCRFLPTPSDGKRCLLDLLFQLASLVYSFWTTFSYFWVCHMVCRRSEYSNQNDLMILFSFCWFCVSLFDILQNYLWSQFRIQYQFRVFSKHAEIRKQSFMLSSNTVLFRTRINIA